MAPATKKQRRRRARRVSEEKPLELAVRVPGVETLPPRPSARLAGPLRALVNALPAASSRDQVLFTRVGLGIVAVVLVTTAKDAGWGFGLAGVLVALATLVVPLAQVRKARWMASIEAMAAPRTRPAPRPAALHYDGRKLTVFADPARERTWTSLRPGSPPHDVLVGRHDGALVLGFDRTGGKKRDSLWFRGPAARPSEPALPAPDRVHDPVEVDAGAWRELLEVFAPHRLEDDR